MQVLITGATGFLGDHLCHRLVRHGHDVTILRRRTSDISALQGLPIRGVVGDVTDGPSLDPAVKGQEVVIHAAAHVGYWRQARELQTRVNVEGTRNLVRACQRHGVRRLVHVSSVAAIGLLDTPGAPANETFPFNLEGVGLDYHVSKRRSEEAVMEAVEAGLDAVVVNPALILGPFRRGFRGGEMIEGVIRRPVVPYFLGGRNVVHVGDVVDGILRALERGRSGERYILGGENLSFRTIAELVAGALGLKRVLVPVPPVVTALAATVLEPLARLTGGRPRITHAVHYSAGRFAFYDSARAQKELGFSARPFTEIVREYVERSSPRLHA